jgi:cytochrome c556
MSNSTRLIEELFSRIERIRAKVNCLSADIETLETAATGQPDGEPTPALKAAISTSRDALKASEIKVHRDFLAKALTDHPRLEPYAAEVEEFHCALERVLTAWPVADAASAAAVITACKATAQRLTTARDRAAQLTIPRQVPRKLKGMRVGKAFDFNGTFKEELPDSEQLAKVLAGLEPYNIGGVVDVKAGLIYKMSTNNVYRFFTYLAPLLALLAGAALLVGIANLKHLGVDFPDSWKLTDAHQLIGVYLLVLGGAVIHLLVENVKQLQMKSVPILVISDGLDWLHLRWMGISLMVVPILITEIGMRVIGVPSGADQPGLWVLAGYSADSIAGMVLTRFDSAAGVWLKETSGQLKGVSSPNPGAGTQ